jgi:uncharacterized phage infection (PIP) family protein YhgE
MALKAIYDKQDDIPEAYRDLFTERDGKFELTGIEGVKTQADVDRLNEGLRKERKKVEDLEAKVKTFGEDTPEAIEELRQENEKLKIQVETGKGAEIDEAKLDELAERKAKTMLAPVERENNRLKKENGELSETNTALNTNISRSAIETEARKVAAASKCVDTAHDDIVMYAQNISELVDGKVVTKDGVGVTPGVGLEVWLSDMQPNKGHWWPASKGGGAGGHDGPGAGSNNPWAKGHWNLTAQGQYVREHGADKAKEMAAQAGSHLGATGPAVAKD